MVLAMGLGPWDLERRAREEAKMVAYLARYSNGACTWDQAASLPVSELNRRVWALAYWIKIENSPSK
jgi:hypothetical protein